VIDRGCYSGGYVWNALYWLYRQFRRRPYREGDVLSVNPDEATWQWMYKAPLVVTGRDWIPARWHLMPGYLYRLRHAEGEVVFHEIWLRRGA
jgi:hypothetical protein